MTKHPDLFAALAAPFSNDEVKVRSQSGRQFHYITARTVMNRLDDVLGPENWWDDFVPNENSVLCRITLVLPDGQQLTKADAGGYAGMADQGDDDKSGYSDAFKRAAVKFGVARYLYRDGVPTFVLERATGGERASPAPSNGRARDAGSPPPGKGEAYEGDIPGDRRPGPRQGGQGGPPRSGKALFAWTRDTEQRHQIGMLKYLNGWAKLQEFPARMVDWSTEQVALAYAEATKKLQQVQAAGSDAYEDALAN